MSYNNPTPVAVALIPLDDGEQPGLLGIVRGIEPGLGLIALPGGYVDEGETIEEAMAREVVEECGLFTQPGDWQLLCSRITPQNRVLVFGVLKTKMSGERIRSLIKPDPREVRGFATIEADTSLAFPLHAEVARKYLAGTL